MQLSDQHIQRMVRRNALRIDPWRPEQQLQPASYDVRLGYTFLIPRSDGEYEEVKDLTQYSVYHIKPFQLVLASTTETIYVPDDVAVRIEGKSTWGRRGLLVHLTAGFIDPGFHGQITLELLNVSPAPLALRPGVRIAQLSFHQLSGPAAQPYGSPGLRSHYQGQTGPTAPHTGR